MYKTYFIDIDGTLFKHMTAEELDAVYLTDHISEILPNVAKYFAEISATDYIVITTARPIKYYEYTVRNLSHHKLRFTKLLMDLGMGPRVLINDITDPCDLKALSHNVIRDHGLGKLLKKN